MIKLLVRVLTVASLAAVLHSYSLAQDTFSIVAIDPRTHEVGSAGASCIDNSLRISDIIEGVGAIHTQAFYLAANQQTAHDRMVAGDSPHDIIEYVTTHDAGNDSTIRQYGVVDLVGGGRSAGYTGVNCNDYKNHITGPTFAIQGNILIGAVVLDSMAYAFTHTPGALADRLMATLMAAKRPGADSRCLSNGLSSLSSFIRVVRVGDGPNQYLFRDVNLSSVVDPIDSLRTLFVAWKDSLSGFADPFLTTVAVDKDTVFTNGLDYGTVVVTVRNNSNQPMGGGFDVGITNSGQGSIGPVNYIGDGKYTARLTPLANGTDLIQVTVSSASTAQFTALDQPVVHYTNQVARIWNGSADSEWSRAENWNPKGSPQYFDTLIIPAPGGGFLPVYGDTGSQVSVTDLRIASGSTLTISTANVSMAVGNRMELHGALALGGRTGGGYSDTLLIQNPASNALIGEGFVRTGTIRRSIQPGSTDIYRFESPQTYVRFDGSGLYPQTMTISPHPDTTVGNSSIWMGVPGAVDTPSHSISTSSLSHFSDWYFGIPGLQGATPRVRRIYSVSSHGGGGFRATMSLRYDSSEVMPPTRESDLELLLPGSPADTISYRSFLPDSIALARDNKGAIGKPVKPGKGMPNAVNVLDEAFQQGIYPANQTGDSLGGMIIGVSYLRSTMGKLKVDAAAAKIHGWIRFGKWDPRKAIGKGYADVLKTLYKKGALHNGAPDRFSFVKELKNVPPTKQNNRLIAEQVALKVNILASLTGKTPAGFANLYYNDGTTNPLNGRTVAGIAATCDTFLTLGRMPSLQLTPLMLFSSMRYVDSVFSGPIDTVKFANGLVLKPVRPLTAASFLHSGGAAQPKVISTFHPIDEGPRAFTLFQNYPNPFNPSTTIQFYLPARASVTLKIYNVLGQEVAALLKREEMDEGTQEIDFDARNLASGVYLYRIEARTVTDPGEGANSETFLSARKMLFVK
jgi:uncharacterized Ntn-hydrolase superfamily protein